MIELTEDQGQKIYNFIRESYKRGGFDRVYDAMDEWEDVGDEERKGIIKEAQRDLNEQNFETFIDYMEYLYNMEERTMKIMRERDKKMSING